jgi:hypothetical protein
MAEIITESGYNNYSSHIIGYESYRLRYETYSFIIPEKQKIEDKEFPIIEAELKSGASV